MRAIFLCFAFAASVAHANLIVNGSFENGSFVPNGQNTMSLPVGSTNMTGWTVFNDTVAWISDPNPFAGIHASNGIRSLDLADYGVVRDKKRDQGDEKDRQARQADNDDVERMDR